MYKIEQNKTEIIQNKLRNIKDRSSKRGDDDIVTGQ